jgi:O-antigen/teichoic acid export membrane protein
MTTTSRPPDTSLGKLLAIDGRSLRVLTTAATSYLGKFVATASVLVTIPIARAALPADLFGIWMMLSGLLAFFAFADLGIGNGVLNRITAAHAAGDLNEQRRTMRAGYACTGTIGALMLASWICWVELARMPTALVGSVAVEHEDEVMAALNIFFFLLAINIPASLVQKMQLGRQRGQWVGLAQAGGAVGTLIAVPASISFGGGLAGLVMASLGMQVAANLASTLLWNLQLYKTEVLEVASRHRQLPEWHAITALMRTGALFLVLQLAAAFAFQSDSIVIVHQLGQAAYGDFAVVQRVFMAASSILLAGLSGLWPAIGEALARGDAAWVKRTLLRSYAIVFTVIGVTCALLSTLMPQILSLWIGMDAPIAMALLVTLTAWTTMEALGNVSAAFLNAAGMLKVQIFFAVLMSTSAFVGKWVLVAKLGAWGAVLATLIAYSLISLPMQIQLLRTRLRQSLPPHA